jgi:hypothetical protein
MAVWLLLIREAFQADLLLGECLPGTLMEMLRPRISINKTIFLARNG